MWLFERQYIARKVRKFLKLKKLKITELNIIVALDHMGYLRDEAERKKWNALKHGGGAYMVGPKDKVQ